MQRAAASTASEPHSHAPPSKRQKISGVPSSTVTSPSNLQLNLAEEEENRGRTIERLAEEAGETNWTLSTVNGDGAHGVGGIRVTKAGYSDIDQEAWRPALVGRRSFGNFNQELEVRFVIVFIIDLMMVILQSMLSVYTYPARL